MADECTNNLRGYLPPSMGPKIQDVPTRFATISKDDADNLIDDCKKDGNVAMEAAGAVLLLLPLAGLGVERSLVTVEKVWMMR